MTTLFGSKLPGEPKLPAEPPEPKLPTEPRMSSQTDLRIEHSRPMTGAPLASSTPTTAERNEVSDVHATYPNLRPQAGAPSKTPSTRHGHPSRYHNAQSPESAPYYGIPAARTAPMLGGQPAVKPKRLGCFMGGALTIAILFLALLVWGIITDMTEDAAREAAREESSNTVYYDSVTPEVSNPVVLLDDENLKVTYNDGHGILQGSSKYPDYCIPVLVENKTSIDINMYFDDVSGKTISDDTDIFMLPYTNLTTGAHFENDFKANTTSLCWLQISEYGSEDDLQDVSATIHVYYSEGYDTIAEYDIVLSDLYR